MFTAIVIGIIAAAIAGFIVGRAVERGQKLQRAQANWARALHAEVLLGAIDHRHVGPTLDLTAEEVS